MTDEPEGDGQRRLAVAAGLGLVKLKYELRNAIDADDFEQADAVLAELIGEEHWRAFVQHHLQRPGPRGS